VGLADELTVLFPWGRLLAAIARAEGDALGRVRALCKPAAAVRFVFGYGAADAGAVSALPALSDPGFGDAVARRYREVGLAVTARVMTAEGICALPTTWAKTLAFSGKARTFWELRGCASEPSAGGGR
jgi:16S rRNA (adenine(1408)-N(1))-methyltransferase